MCRTEHWTRTPTTPTDHFVGLRFRYDAVVPAGVATLGTNTFSGTQTAPAFAGDGSGLTSVDASLLAGLPPSSFAAAAHGHQVTEIAGAATLGPNIFAGLQSIEGNNLDLDALTATSGNVTKDGLLFLHDFGFRNTFLGVNAGNVSMAGALNSARR